MNRVIIKRYLLALLLFLLPIISLAAVPTWQIVPAESSLTFTGTQNGAPASGSFKKFTGDIAFDPNQLKESKVKIIIDISSVTTTYRDFTSTLLTPDWLNAIIFPNATFIASHFNKIGNNKYTAEGSLTLRDKTIPVTVLFDTEELSKTKGRVKGSTTIKRTQFGVGQGEWADTDTVKDEVQVDFVITAIHK